MDGVKTTLYHVFSLLVPCLWLGVSVSAHAAVVTIEFSSGTYTPSDAIYTEDGFTFRVAAGNHTDCGPAVGAAVFGITPFVVYCWHNGGDNAVFANPVTLEFGGKAFELISLDLVTAPFTGSRNPTALVFTSSAGDTRTVPFSPGTINFNWEEITFVTISITDPNTGVADAAIDNVRVRTEREFDAYVLIGNINGTPGSGYTGRVAENAANEAQSDYEKAGYNVIRRDQASRQDFLDALANPKARAIWFFGHGEYSTRTGLFGKEKLGGPLAELQLTDGNVKAADLGGTYSKIEQVTLHACGQNLLSWRSVFPNADFASWSTAVRPQTVWWWQFGATYPPPGPEQAPQKSPQPQRVSLGAAAASCPDPLLPPIVHPRLEQTGQFFIDPDSGLLVNDLAPVTNTVDSFVLSNDLWAHLDGKVFNFFVEISNQSLLLFSAAIVGGVVNVSSQSTDYAPQAAFDIFVTGEAYRLLIENPDFWPAISTSSAVQLVNHTGGIIPDEAVLDGVGRLMWGTPAGAEGEAPSACANIVRAAEKGRCSAAVSYTVTATDACPSAALQCFPPSGATFPVGTTPIDCTATLSEGETVNCTSTVTINDVEVPALSGVKVDKPTLWPPNHKMVDVVVHYSVTDNCRLRTDGCRLTVTSNQGTSSDWEILDAHRVRLRATRTGSGQSGRTYWITITCPDEGGNASSQTVTVTVPHDQGKK